MKIQFEIEMPAMPNFLRFKKEAQMRQDGFKVNDGYPISNLTREEAEEFAESWKQTFLKHWANRVKVRKNGR